MLVAERATAAALRKLGTAEVPWAPDDGRYRVDATHARAAPLSTESLPPRRSDPRAALALLLVERPQRSQRALANLLGVSQPRVSRLLRWLVDSGVEISSSEQLSGLWTRSHHDPQDEAKHWFAEHASWRQVGLAYAHLDAAGHNTGILPWVVR